MSKFFLAIIAVALLLVNNSKANDMSGLKLTGQIVNIEISEENEKTIFLKLFLDLKFTNEGTKPIILYWHDFWINSTNLFKKDENKNEEFLYSNGGLASNSTSSDWFIIQRSLHQEIPPPEITKTLNVGDSVNWKAERGLQIYKKKQSYTANESWKEILKNSPVLLTVELEMFPKNLDKSDKENNSFGKQLQKKWLESGFLRLEKLISEPISVDLIPAVAKAELNRKYKND